MAETTATTNPSTTAMRELEPEARPRAVRKPRGILVPLWLGYVFLYLPILVVVIMSFNDSENLFVWRGFSLRWYPELFADEQIMQGLVNTLIVATGATAIATVLGTLLAYGIQHYTRGGLHPRVRDRAGHPARPAARHRPAHVLLAARRSRSGCTR